jgi:deoxyadenosine/deoxycytidine kinase
MIVEISGMMGAGKSTLKNILSNHKDWIGVDEGKMALDYLPDLFSDPSRWAFEAQSSFLLEKYNQYSKASKQSSTVILDRSFDEDADIFFDYFYENFIKEDRAKRTYRLLLNTITRELKDKEIQIICEVSLDEAKERIESRKNKFKEYLPGHVDDIYKKYTSYISRKSGMENVYFLDSAEFDVRNENVSKSVLSDVDLIVSGSDRVDGLTILKKTKTGSYYV